MDRFGTGPTGTGPDRLTGYRSNRTGSHRFGEPCVGEAEKVAMVVDLDDWTSPFDTLTHQLLIELIIFFVVHMLISLEKKMRESKLKRLLTNIVRCRDRDKFIPQ